MFTGNIAQGRSIFKSLVSGVDTIKACTLSDCVVAAIIFQDLGVQHFVDENVHMLFYVADQTVNSGTRW